MFARLCGSSMITITPFHLLGGNLGTEHGVSTPVHTLALKFGGTPVFTNEETVGPLNI